MNQPTRGSRGRHVTPQRSLKPFYLALALIALLGLTAIGGMTWRSASAGTAVAPANTTASSTTAASGQTSDGFWYLGNAGAPVTITLFSDFQCPFCAVFATQIEPTIVQQYVETGKARLVYRDFPLVTIHANAIVSAAAARCAGDQNAFWPMHDLLFANQLAWDNLGDPAATFAGYAATLTLDTATFTQCLAGGTYDSTLTAAYDSAVAQGLQGTPTVTVNNQVVTLSSLAAAPSEIAAAIDAALAGQ